ncbi:hypothetical protein [Streptomyces xinghaiensis]|uniref:hypothetical protein n=1 Tax=Streptomyces xinghaiensis TaxID=1038928 RepID=UPI000BAF513A|nr:hypothetical protein [Streptomyces xinghaiensis]
MSDEEAGAAPAAGGRDAAAGPGRDEPGEDKAGASPERPRALQGPRGPAGGGADAVQAVREARANFTVHGANTVVDSAAGAVHVGDVYQFGGRPSLVSGAVPRDELRALRLVFAEPPGYGELRALLTERRIIALCGDPGTGRGYAALSLLDELTRGTVERMDPRTELDRIADTDIQDGHGYLTEIAVDGFPARAGAGDTPAGTTGGDHPARSAAGARPAEIHLDRLRDLLTARDAYAVLVVDAGDFADELLRGRYGTLFRPPDAESVLRRHLRPLLGAGGTEAVERAVAVSCGEDVTGALGLEQLRPHEAVTLAGLLARHAKDELTDDGLRAECAGFAARQARAWFAGAGRGGSLGTALTTLRPAAFRSALAVYNGAPYSVAAEAAEQLAWEFAATWAPEEVPGRPLFTDNLQARLTAARAVLEDGAAPVGDVEVPVRTVRFQGRALSSAVLGHIWDQHHNARGPLSRWLRTLCDDSRPAVWVPAAVATGALSWRDYPYVLAELVLPMAAADSASQRMAAATATAEGARHEAVRGAARALVRGWARGTDPLLRRTAALVHGYGSVEESLTAGLDELGRLAGAASDRDGGAAETETDWGLLEDTAYSVVRLLAGPAPGTVVTRIGRWLGDGRASRRDLGLLCVVGAVSMRAWALWGLEDRTELEPYLSRPLVAALLAVEPGERHRLADLVRFALDNGRSRDAVLTALTDWIRRGERDTALLEELCRFLPLVAADEPGRERLRHLAARLERDPDESVDPAVTARVREALAPGEGNTAP